MVTSENVTLLWVRENVLNETAGAFSHWITKEEIERRRVPYMRDDDTLDWAMLVDIGEQDLIKAIVEQQKRTKPPGRILLRHPYDDPDKVTPIWYRVAYEKEVNDQTITVSACFFKHGVNKDEINLRASNGETMLHKRAKNLVAQLINQHQGYLETTRSCGSNHHPSETPRMCKQYQHACANALALVEHRHRDNVNKFQYDVAIVCANDKSQIISVVEVQKSHANSSEKQKFLTQCEEEGKIQCAAQIDAQALCKDYDTQVSSEQEYIQLSCADSPHGCRREPYTCDSCRKRSAELQRIEEASAVETRKRDRVEQERQLLEEEKERKKRAVMFCGSNGAHIAEYGKENVDTWRSRHDADVNSIENRPVVGVLNQLQKTPTGIQFTLTDASTKGTTKPAHVKCTCSEEIRAELFDAKFRIVEGMPHKVRPFSSDVSVDKHGVEQITFNVVFPSLENVQRVDHILYEEFQFIARLMVDEAAEQKNATLASQIFS